MFEGSIRESGLPARSELKVVFEIAVAEDGRWRVRLFKNVYGEYADRGRARRFARKAGADARLLGYQVEVWDRSKGKRLL
jgi:hypothetical protein